LLMFSNSFWSASWVADRTEIFDLSWFDSIMAAEVSF
jgi:hypothetical protein